MIKFPRNVMVDLNNVPQDFEDMIRKSFEEYTEYTAKFRVPDRSPERRGRIKR